MKTPAAASMTAHRAETQRKYKKEKKKRRRIRKAEKKRELEQKRHENQELAGAATEKPPKPTKWRRITDCKKAVDRPVDEAQINDLLERRTKAKASKEYAVADGIMEQLVELEIVYDDARKEWHTRELGGVGGKKKQKDKEKDATKAAAATVNHIESMDDFNAMLETSKSQACIVDFTATWCPPCKMIAPIFEGLAKEHASVRFFKADVDEADEVAEKCKIQAMPTFRVFRKGEMVDQMDGADPDGLKKLLEKHS